MSEHWAIILIGATLGLMALVFIVVALGHPIIGLGLDVLLIAEWVALLKWTPA